MRNLSKPVPKRLLTRLGTSLSAAFLSLLLAACSDSRDPRITMTTQADEGGQLSPTSQLVDPSSTATFRINPEPGYELRGISGCGGQRVGNRYIAGPADNDCTILARFRLARYLISTSTDGNGQISPSSQTYTIEDSPSFTLTANEGFRVDQVSGCGGTLEGNTYRVETVEASCRISASFEPDVYEVSGEISAAAFSTFDATLNDLLHTELLQDVANTTFGLAQPINNRATVAGYASNIATGNICTTGFPENFDVEPNPYDFYQVSLQAGQLIQLQVVNFENHTGTCESQGTPRPTGDFSLTLFDADENPVTSTLGGAEYQEMVVPSNGRYVIQVSADEGISRYVLRLLPEGTPPMTDLRLTVQGDFVPGEMLVKERPATQTQGVGRARAQSRNQGQEVYRQNIAPRSVQRQSGPAQGVMDRLQQRNPQAFARLETLAAIRDKRRDPGVEYAEPNYIRTIQREPNDPGYRFQWHYNAIDLPGAWAITQGQPQGGNAPPLVAVLDTGVVLNHPDLAAKLTAGYDFVENNNDPGDPGDGDDTRPDSWHGTHVAGTIAADTNNNIGGAGVSWGAQIMPVRVLGPGGGTSFDVQQGLRYAAGLSNRSGTLPDRPADIINLSLGGPGFSQSEADLYARVRDEQGIIIVAASGNEGDTTPFYPAAYASVLSVGATNALGERTRYSSFGPSLSLAAPGGYLGQDANGDGLPDGIYSTAAERQGDEILTGYAYYQGTSMAAPHVAGVLALMKAVHPDLTPDEFDSLLTSGSLTGQAERNNQLGYGQIDARLSVVAAMNLADGEPISMPSRIALSPSRINMGNDSEATVALTHEGSGEPALLEIATDQHWLTLEATADAENDPRGLGDYRILIDRDGLEEGFYQGTARFVMDDATEATLQVYLQEGAPSSEGELTILYVLLVNAEAPEDEDDVVAQTIAIPLAGNAGAARFVFEAVPPGRYTLVAGSDIDADGFICQTGEQCGAYPSLEREQSFEVTDSDRLERNFVARILSGVISNSLQTDTRSEPSEHAYPRRVTPDATVPPARADGPTRKR